MGSPAHNRAAPGAARTPSGALSRSKKNRQARRTRQAELSEADALFPGLERKRKTWESELKQSPWKRKLDVPAAVLRDQKTSTVQGRLLFFEGQACGISKSQYEAAEWYFSLRNQYLCCVGAPGAVNDTPEGYAPSGDPDAHERYCDGVKSRWGSVKEGLEAVSMIEGRRWEVFKALDIMIIQQRCDWDLIGDLRYALNAVDKVRNGKRSSIRL